MAVVVRALHHLDHLPIVRLRADHHPVDHVADHHLHVQDHRAQVLPVHPVRIATVHHQVGAQQVVVTHPIAALTQVVHQPHVEIHPVQVRVQVQIAGSVVTVQEIRVHHHVHLRIVESAVTVQEIHDHHQIVPIVHHVRMAIEIHVRHRVQVQIVQLVVHTVTATHVRRPAHLQIVPIVRHVRTVTDQNVAMTVVHQVTVQRVVHTVTEIHARVLIVEIVQRDVPTVTEIHVRHHVQVRIDQQAVHTVTEIPVQAPIVHRVRTVTDQNVVMIAALQVIAQLVAHTETAIHAHLHVQVLIVHVAKIHTVAIVHALAMTATHVRLQDTANAVVVPTVPEVASPMIAKNVHAVALAKSA